MNRNLDGVYFRVKRDGKWENICFSDLTSAERLDAMKGKSEDWLKGLCIVLSETLQQVGDQFDLVREEE